MALKYKFNVITGNLDLVDEATIVGASYNVDKITLNGTDITNKYVVLSNAPTDKPVTRLVVIEGIEQDYGTDFVVTTDDANKRLSWNGLGLDGILVNGDKIIVIYN